MLFSKSKKIVGLDIDTHEVRAIELSGSFNKPILESFGTIDLPEGAVDDGIIINPDKVSGALVKLWSENNFKSRNVILGVSNQEVLVRYATFPKVDEDKLAGLIKHQAQDYIPIPLASVILDHTIIGEVQEDNRQMFEVILVAAKRNMLDIFISTLKEANLNVWDIDVSSLVLTKILPETQQEGAVVLVDVAFGQSNILIVDNKIPRLARRVAVRLKDLAALLNFYPRDLFAYPMVKDFPRDIFFDWADTLINEIRSSITYYQTQKKALPIENVFISGKGARAPGLIERASNDLQIPVNPVANIIEDDIETINNPIIDYSLAISLALRGLEG